MSPTPPLTITLVAALSADGVIGTGEGGIPWDLPRDAAHFRSTVEGKSLLLGRKTYGEMAGWFRDERPIVLTSDPTFRPREEAAGVAPSLDEALSLAAREGATEIMVCGGASVYALALPLVSRMILTHVAVRLGDTFPNAVRFPNLDPSEWSIEREAAFPADDENAYAMRIVWYRRSEEHLQGSAHPHCYG